MKPNPGLFRTVGKLLAIAGIIMFFNTCKQTGREPLKIDPGFARYISAFTSGMVSSGTTVKIILAADVATTKQSLQGILKLSPTVAGKLQWLDARTIEFIPEARLKQGTVYTVDLQLGKLIDVPGKFSIFKFQFQTFEQSAAVIITGLEPINPVSLRYYKLLGTIQTADFAEEILTLKSLTASLDASPLKITWDHSGDGTMHYFTIDSINRKELAGQVLVYWDGSVFGLRDKSVDTVNIPALGDFSVLSALAVQKPEQYIEIRFSDPIDPLQDLEGLISCGNEEGWKLETALNVVKCFPPSKTSGEVSITVSTGILNTAGYKMPKSFQATLLFEDMQPGVRFAVSGNIIPRSGGFSVPFEAVNLSAVDVRVIRIYESNIMQFFQSNQFDNSNDLKRIGRPVYSGRIDLQLEPGKDPGNWNAFSLDLGKLFRQEPGAIYQVSLGLRKEYSLYDCGETNERKEGMSGIVTEGSDPGMDDQYWDGPEYYWYSSYPEDFDWNERDNPCHSSYYTSERQVTKNVLSSDLGIIAKAGADNSYLCAVTDITTAKPVQNAEIVLFNYQLQPIAKGLTGVDGNVMIESTHKPFMLVASHKGNRGYLKLDDGSSLSLSQFDVSGSEVQKGVKGYIYTERGVWRPGDSLYVMFIIDDRNNPLPQGHPVVFELTDPRGQNVRRIVKTSSLNGFYDFRTATSSDAPTGNWIARVEAGKAIFTKRLKIESVKPNRLKIDLDFGTPILTGIESGIRGNLGVKWLHGAPARNLRAEVSVMLRKSDTRFKGYPDYEFNDPAREFYPEEQAIFSGNVNEQGKVTFNAQLPAYQSPPGMLQADFTMRAFEEGGNFSIGYLTLPYSPFQHYIGLKYPKSRESYGSLFTDSTYVYNVVTVDKDGKPVSVKDLNVSIHKIHWRWWWQASDDNLANYMGSSSSYEVFSTTLNTVNGKGSFEVKLPYPEWGRFLVRVSDPEGGHSTGSLVYYDWPEWYSRSGRENPGGATMLSFSSDKPDYKVGETAVVTFPSGGIGKALASIESGSRIIKAWWLDAGKTETSFKFEVTPEMAPNVFIHITLIQPHRQTTNDLPIRLYGVVPINVTDPSTHLKPVIKMPDELAPGQSFTIEVKEKSGKPMTYTVAMVDDGLLDLTRFKTPDPWPVMYAREALGVKTWDLYDYILGAFGGSIGKLFAIGGDESLEESGKAKVNRFKPVVKFLGPFKIGAGGTARHKITMPNYVGSVRTMVVAGEKGAYGSAEKTTPVRKSLMVLATLPRVLGPGEIFRLPVTVFAMDPKIKNAEVKVSGNSLVEISGSSDRSLQFNAIGDQVVYFDLKVRNTLGKARVNVTAVSGKENATYEVEIEVRNPNPMISNIKEGIIKPGETWQHEYKAFGMKGTNEGILEISSIPPIDLGRRLRYLLEYPYGCIEQTTSTAFPQLYLADLVDMNASYKTIIDANIKSAIASLRRFQVSSGGMSYWPGSREVSQWATTYAGHFMLEAEAKGYTLPPGFKTRWVKYQKEAARTWQTSAYSDSYYDDYDDLTQAYRLYTLALAGEPAFGAMNRLRENTGLSLQARWRLAAAYFLSGKPEAGKELIQRSSTNVDNYAYDPVTFGSAERDIAMIVESLCLMGDKEKALPLVINLSRELSSNQWMSTQTTAYALIAISRFAASGGNQPGTVKFKLSLADKTEDVIAGKPFYQKNIDINSLPAGRIELTNKGTSLLYARFIMRGKPLESEVQNTANNLKISVSYESMSGSHLDESSLPQGLDFKAIVTVQHPGVLHKYNELALAQVFPSGWEILNSRLGDMETTGEENRVTYTDIRDDRVYTFFDLDRGRSKTFVVLLNASYAGRFYLPPVSCEAMYDHSISAAVRGKWVEVKPAVSNP